MHHCSGLKIHWGSPHGSSYLRNAYYVLHSVVLHTFLTMALSQARNLLRPNNLLGDLTDDFVNNFISFN